MMEVTNDTTINNKRPGASTTSNNKRPRMTNVYDKREGTTGGYKGHEYEILLISLILFRLQRHKDIEDFFLASNYGGLGAFDDICFKALIKGRDRPVYVFIQAKHKEDDTKRFSYDLTKLGQEGHETIRAKLCANVADDQRNEFFNGEDTDKDCIMLILYTNATVIAQRNVNVSNNDGYFNFSNFVKDVIATSPEKPIIFSYPEHKIVAYNKQSNHNGVEEMLKCEIRHHLKLLPHSGIQKHDEIKVFRCYHHRVRDWWMTKGSSEFLSKSNDLYQEAINIIGDEPQMTAMHNSFYMYNIEYFNYDFTDDAMRSMDYLREHKTNIVVLLTDITMFTTMKVIYWLRNNYNTSYSIIDLEQLLKLPNKEINSLINEISVSKNWLIFVCTKTDSNSTQYKRLTRLKIKMESETVIIIKDNKSTTPIEKWFDRTKIAVNDQRLSLMDLSPDSRWAIIKNVKVIFQGREVELNKLLKYDSNVMTCIEGAMLRKLLQKEIVNIGQPLKDPHYEEIKDKYIERRVCLASNFGDDNESKNAESSYYHINDGMGQLLTSSQYEAIQYASAEQRDYGPSKFYDDNEQKYVEYGPNFRPVSTFFDINDDVVLLTSTTGVGKSTLLSHLSYNTRVGEFWLVRINLIKHTKELEKWQRNKIIIDWSVVLNYICQVTLNNYVNEISFNKLDGRKHAQDHVDSKEDTFELQLFLHFYNEGKLILLLDGFDDICPDYKDGVIDFIKIIKKELSKLKLWVTTRPHRELLSDLEDVLGEAYVLEYMNDKEQRAYLTKMWQCKSIPASRVLSQNLKMILLSSNMAITKSVDLNLITYCFLNYNLELPDCVHVAPGTRRALKFAGNPFLLNLSCDYFGNLIIHAGANNIKDSLNLFHMYEEFTEKIMVMSLEMKTQSDFSLPSNKKLYETKIRSSIIEYKQIAGYTVFRKSVFHDDFRLKEFKDMPFNEKSKMEIKKLIENLNLADDAGLISYVTRDNVPIFIHGTFAEYFATEFICAILKSNIDRRRKQLLYSVICLYSPFMIKMWICDKRKLDKELDTIIKDIEINTLLWDLGTERTHFYLPRSEWTAEQNIRVHCSSVEDYKYHGQLLITYILALEPLLFYNKTTSKYLACKVIAGMKPHLQKYFPLSRSRSTPFEKIRKRICSLESTIITHSFDDASSSNDSEYENED